MAKLILETTALFGTKLYTDVVLRSYEIVSLIPCCVEVHLIQHYVVKFVSDLRQVTGFLQVLQFPLPIKLTATI